MKEPVAVLVKDPPQAKRVLHLGCGRKGRDVLFVTEPIAHVTTLDADGYLEPDLICELGVDPIPLSDNSIDIAVAVHVLEHIGMQGETARWFQFWEELYRVIVPNGELRFESPMYDSTWAWSDPSHTRALSPQAFVFLSQDSYRVPHSAISPFRLRADFVPVVPFTGVVDPNPEIAAREQFSSFRGTLRAVKPLKPWWSDE
jgi:hypothetical protein